MIYIRKDFGVFTSCLGALGWFVDHPSVRLVLVDGSIYIHILACTSQFADSLGAHFLEQYLWVFYLQA